MVRQAGSEGMHPAHPQLLKNECQCRLVSIIAIAGDSGSSRYTLGRRRMWSHLRAQQTYGRRIIIIARMRMPFATLENSLERVGQLRRHDALHRTRKAERVLRTSSRDAPTLRRRTAALPHHGPELQRHAAVVDGVVVPRAVMGVAHGRDLGGNLPRARRFARD
ncbi:hypothetical protein PG996_006898 [Apiospora saccharicola]|uniref:Uncharacterized protein n=1 Tax=Apiospora saccharicola TaxID=335842 RepID=A0ABR1V9C2_9PEZI